MLVIKNACKRFGNHQVLDHVDLVIGKGKIVGLAGPSGGGKSTLLRCMQGLETLDAGVIQYGGDAGGRDSSAAGGRDSSAAGGRDSSAAGGRDSSAAGFMFQDFQLFPHMTVLQNLVYAPSLQGRGKRSGNNENKKNNKESNKKSNKEQIIAAARKLLQDLGVAAKESAYPAQLSGGQKQRVALARSLMMHPELLLCDEPTSGLDVATTLDVIALLQSVRDMGITMVIASHDLDFLTKIADQVVLLKHGKIAVSVELRGVAGESGGAIELLKGYY